jgi:ketosteroid isomerase-like protein
MESKDVIVALWHRIQARDWAGVGELIAADAVIEWPDTAERIVGREAFVRVQREYPEGWSIAVLRLVAEGDQVVSEVEVPHTGLGVFRAASFWTVVDGMVVEGREYWSTPGSDPVPAWRQSITEPM